MPLQLDSDGWASLGEAVGCTTAGCDCAAFAVDEDKDSGDGSGNESAGKIPEIACTCGHVLAEHLGELSHLTAEDEAFVEAQIEKLGPFAQTSSAARRILLGRLRTLIRGPEAAEAATAAAAGAAGGEGGAASGAAGSADGAGGSGPSVKVEAAGDGSEVVVKSEGGGGSVAGRKRGREEEEETAGDGATVDVGAVARELPLTPPYESPTIATILSRFVECRFPQSSISESKFQSISVLVETTLSIVNSYGPALPTAASSDPVYQLLCDRWASLDEASRPSVAEAFGRYVLACLVPTLEAAVLKAGLPADYRTMVPKFFVTLQQELAHEGSPVTEPPGDFERHIAPVGHIIGFTTSASTISASIAASQGTGGASTAGGASSSLSGVMGDGTNLSAGALPLEYQRLAHAQQHMSSAQRAVASGEIALKVIANDGKRESLRILTSCKELFGKQLPKMPKEYITRLVFDKKHRTLCVVRGEWNVVAAVCFRPFSNAEVSFLEIAFLAVRSNQQVSGYGRLLMSHLKEMSRRASCYSFLTYADNFALGYFRKMGFGVLSTPTGPTKGTPTGGSHDGVVPKWQGVIKDYDGGTLVHARIHPLIDYLKIEGMLRAQKEAVLDCIRKVSSSHMTYPGINVWKEQGDVRVPVAQIPGVMEAGWKASAAAESRSLDQQLRDTLRALKAHNAVWPFLEPVDPNEVPDYHTIVSDPICVADMERKLAAGVYVTSDIFYSDLQRIVDNARYYNKPTTVFYGLATQIEAAFLKEWQKKTG